MKKGYTLVELLGVMIILGLILLVSFPIIINQIKKSNEAISESTRILIESSAELYINDNEDEYPINPGATYYVAVETLVNEGLVSKSLKDLDIKDYVKVTVNEDKTLAFEIVDEKPEPSFANDSWATIAANVKAGNMSVYNVGDTKEITLTGSGDLAQTLTVRVANNTTPAECNQEGFSQSACGFVVEFVDIITTSSMKSVSLENNNISLNDLTQLNDSDPEPGDPDPEEPEDPDNPLISTNKGGWPNSESRSYLNEDIYNVLPDDLKKVISNTYVVSGHGSLDTNNFNSVDKLYLLSTKEVWGSNLSYDTATAETRQLDYYSNLGVSINNYSEVTKYWTAVSSWWSWWLRTPYSNSETNAYFVNSDGNSGGIKVNTDLGLAPAFRIG